jgi:hypothetical protein
VIGYLIGRGLPRTVKKVKDFSAVEAGKSNTHTIYFCPYCHEKEKKYNRPNPKPDTKGKLYLSVAKFIGFCFRCNTG